MTLITPSRRGLITGLATLIAAPAIVRVSSLMAVKAAPVHRVGLEALEAYLANTRRGVTLNALGGYQFINSKIVGINREPQAFWKNHA